MANVNGGLIKNQQQTPDPVVENKKRMQGLIVSMKDEIKKALPSVITGERFTRMILTAMSNTPELMNCSSGSFLGAMMQAAQLGLEPNTPLGQAYLIPYKNKGNLECQFQLGYKGLIDLAYRSGEVTIVQAHEVHENDKFEYSYGLDPKLEHVPAMKARGQVIAYYAIFKTKSGGYGFHVASADDIKQHAKKYSKSFNSSYSPWQTCFDEMAKKTVLKQCLKYAPLKSDFTRAVVSDETIKSSISDDMSGVEDEMKYDTIDAAATDVSQSKPVNMETGEIIDAEMSEDDQILAESLGASK